MNWTKINSLNDIPKEVFENIKNRRVLLTIENKYGTRYIMPIHQAFDEYHIPYTSVSVEKILEQVYCKVVSYAVVDPDSKIYHNIKPGDVFVVPASYHMYVVTQVHEHHICYRSLIHNATKVHTHDLKRIYELQFIGRFMENDDVQD